MAVCAKTNRYSVPRGPPCTTSSRGCAVSNSRASSFLRFRFILPVAICLLLLPENLDQARPGCDRFTNLSNGVKTAVVLDNSRHHASDRQHRSHAVNRAPSTNLISALTAEPRPLLTSQILRTQPRFLAPETAPAGPSVAVYQRMRERISVQLRDFGGLLKYLELRGIPGTAGSVLMTAFTEDGQAREARLRAASALSPESARSLFIYYDPGTISGIVAERLSPADHTLDQAKVSYRQSTNAAILLKRAAPELGKATWQGNGNWYLYRQ